MSLVLTSLILYCVNFIWLLSNENIIIINIVIKLLMSLTETRTKLLSGSEVCPRGSLPSSHCIITSNIVVQYSVLAQ